MMKFNWVWRWQPIVYITLLTCIFMGLPVCSWAGVLPIQHWQTDNGASVWFVRSTALPMIKLEVEFPAGSAQDGQHLGIANLVSAMLDEGTENLNAQQLANTFDQVGAEYNVTLDRDRVQIRLTSLSDHQYLDSALRTFIAVLTQPTFPTDALTRVKSQIQTAIRERQQNPTSIAIDALYQQLYGQTPYGHSPLGNLASIDKITRRQILAFYQQHYTAHDADVIIVGHIKSQAAHQIAKSITASLPTNASARTGLSITPTTPTPFKVPVKAPIKAPEVEHIVFPSTQTTFLYGQLGITPNNPDYFPLLIANHILGGGNLISLLSETLRKQLGLVYYALSQFTILQYRGPFIIMLQSKASNAAKVMNAVSKVMKTYLHAGPTIEQFNTAKLNLIGRFPLQLDSNEKIMVALSNMAFYNRPLDYLDKYQQHIQAVTRGQLLGALKHAIHPDHFFIVTVGPQQFLINQDKADSSHRSVKSTKTKAQ